MALAHDAPHTKSGYAICTICDIGCQFRAFSENGKLTEIKARIRGQPTPRTLQNAA